MYTDINRGRLALVGIESLRLRVRNDSHRNLRVVDHVMADTAEYRSSQKTHATCPHHDHARLELVGHRHDHVTWRSDLRVSLTIDLQNEWEMCKGYNNPILDQP